MIVASLLLIPVAVVFLALGLVNGSSNLLIASIVISLLVAAALVLGARQTAARRGAEQGNWERPGPMPEPEAPPAAGARPERETPQHAEAASYAEAAPHSESVRYARGEDSSDPHAGDSAPPAVTFAGESAFADQAGAAAPEAGPESARRAGRRDADEHFHSEHDGISPDTANYAESDSRPEPVDDDYDRAASTIGASRAAETADTSWRRPAEPAAPPVAADATTAGPVEPGTGTGTASTSPGSAAGSQFETGAATDPGVRAGAAVGPGFSTGTAEADEFGEPDDDDPDDEPLPQSVRPADAVLVARLDAEVLVVDGRPRYHLADCPHLVGRLTEPLPVNEAVELGFSPCGLCRPVDRLVAAVARH